MRRLITGLLLIIPFLFVTFPLTLYPIFYNFYLSFYRWDLVISKEKTFVSLENYGSILPSSFFQKILLNTFVFTILTCALTLFGGLFLALFLSKLTKGRKIYTTLFLIPLMVPEVFYAMAWKFLYAPYYGIINFLIGRQIMWLSNPDIALYSIIIADSWNMMPWFMIVLLASILSIPVELSESIRMDGASIWQEFRYLILPHLMPIIFISTILRTIDGFTKVFGIVYLLTSGGPGIATQVLPVWIFTKTLQSFRWGEAATYSVITIFISLIFLVVQVKWVYRK